jgi:hypothetical protein
MEEARLQRLASTPINRLQVKCAAASIERMAPQVGLEPTTLRLTAECSAIELLRSVVKRAEGALAVFIIASPLRSENTEGVEGIRCGTLAALLAGGENPWGWVW